MYHYTAHALGDAILFRDWIEARALWNRLIRASLGLVSASVMPDHIHVLTTVACRRQLQHTMSAYTRWRNAHRGERGSAFGPMDPPTVARTREKQRRDQRYIHLNPCREHLATDPLEWPFSTHRDAVGLAVPLVRRPHPDPHGFHRYVSGDPTVHVQGTHLPLRAEADLYGPDALLAVWAAVAAVSRTPARLIPHEAEARRLFIRAARTLTPASTRAIANMAQVHQTTVLRATVGMDREVAVVERVCGDPRFRDMEQLVLPCWRRSWRRR